MALLGVWKGDLLSSVYNEILRRKARIRLEIRLEIGLQNEEN